MSGSGITPTSPNGAQSSAPKGQVVQIVSLPEALRDNARSIRIEGDVVQQNKDGSVRVRTEYGDIDIQVRGRQPQPATRVELDIPAGHPPRQANVRTAAPPPAPAQASPPPSTPPPQAQAQQPQEPATQSPVRPAPSQAHPPAQNAPAQTPDPDIVTIARPQAPAQAATTQQAAPPHTVPQQAVVTTLPSLSSGQSVQLLPFMDSDMAGQHPAAVITDKTAAQAGLIAQKSQSSLISTMLQAVKSVLPDFSAALPQKGLAPPNIVGLSQPLTIATGANPSAAQAALPAIALPATSASVSLGAHILSVTAPLEQRIFVPAGQQAIVPPLAGAASTPAMATPVTATITQPDGTMIRQADQSITVTIGQTTAQNKPVITVSATNGAVQSFVLQASATATPPGTQITLLPQLTITPAPLGVQSGQASIAAPHIPASTISAMPPAWRALLPPMQALPVWPVIDEMFQTFYQATPQAAQILGRIMPSPANAATFGPAALLFIAAAKSGDLQSWLGDKKLDMLQKLGKASLVSRLSSEAAQLSQNTDAAASDWKSYPFPLLHQNEISKVMLHLRREPDENENERENDATHFVMDVSLNRMGNVQLDALVRGNRVDLVVRTELPVSSSMQDAMRTAYATALDNTGIYGDIGFQSDIKNFVRVIGRESALASA